MQRKKGQRTGNNLRASKCVVGKARQDKATNQSFPTLLCFRTNAAKKSGKGNCSAPFYTKWLQHDGSSATGNGALCEWLNSCASRDCLVLHRERIENWGLCAFPSIVFFSNFNLLSPYVSFSLSLSCRNDTKPTSVWRYSCCSASRTALYRRNFPR